MNDGVGYDGVFTIAESRLFVHGSPNDLFATWSFVESNCRRKYDAANATLRIDLIYKLFVLAIHLFEVIILNHPS